MAINIINRRLFYILLLLPYTSTNYSDNVPIKDEKILGGRDTRIWNHTYMALLEQNGTAKCSCALLSDLWVTTVAHCIIGWAAIKKEGRVRVGSSFNGESGFAYEIDKAIPHPQFNNYTLVYNIGVIKSTKSMGPLDKEHNKIAIKPVGSNYIAGTGQVLVITGFGRTSFGGKTSKRMQEATVEIVGDPVCLEEYPRLKTFAYTLPETLFCASGDKGAGCWGDSGSPAVLGDKLVGLLITYSSCRALPYPMLFTSIADSFLWIENVTGLLL